MTLAVNLTAPYLLCKAFLPTFLAKKSGRIINVASLAGKMGLIHGSAYAASKHGLLGLTRCLALEVADQESRSMQFARGRFAALPTTNGFATTPDVWEPHLRSRASHYTHRSQAGS